MDPCDTGTIINAFLQAVAVWDIVEKYVVIGIYRSVCVFRLSLWVPWMVPMKRQWRKNLYPVGYVNINVLTTLI